MTPSAAAVFKSILIAFRNAFAASSSLPWIPALAGPGGSASTRARKSVSRRIASSACAIALHENRSCLR